MELLMKAQKVKSILDLKIHSFYFFAEIVQDVLFLCANTT